MGKVIGIDLGTTNSCVSVMDGVDDTVPFIARMAGIDAYAMSEADWSRVQEKLRALVPHLRFVSSDDTALA